MTQPALQGAVCANHSGISAVEVCTRCGSFLCADCVEYGKDAETPYCARCVGIVSQRASRRSRVALALAALGVLGLPAGVLVRARGGLAVWALAVPLGFVGLALAIQELRAIERNEAAAAGRRWAGAARVVGFLHLVGVLLIVASFAWFLYATAGSAAR